MADEDNLAQGNTRSPVNYQVSSEEGIKESNDPIMLDIPDLDLVKIIDERIKRAKSFFADKYDLYNRRKKTEMYYFGRQIADKEKRDDIKPYESRDLDNVLYEIEASIKPLAMSRLPDMIITPGSETEDSQQTAEEVSKCINTDLKKRENRRVLALAFKHTPVYFQGVIKARWDPQKGDSGDYVFEVTHPDTIVVDNNSTSNNADDMDFVAQLLSLTVQEAIMRFPEKREALFEKLRQKGLMTSDKPNWKNLGSEIKIWEVWSRWYKKVEVEAKPDQQPDQEAEYKWEKIEGVVWKYDNLILKKIKDPNYDWVGETKVFTYDDPMNELSKRAPSEEEVMTAMTTGQFPILSQEKIFHNYFDRPHKPFFFMGYDQWGKQPIDETSRIEQNIMNQENIDKRNKQINETLDNRGKHIFSKEGGLKADDIEQMDMNDPAQDILTDGDVNKVHDFIPPDRPTPQEFENISQTRDRMYAIAGSSAVRGDIQSDVATTNQIAREADFTRADDLVEDTINSASEWMAMWSLQFIKLRYTEKHLRRMIGNKGTVVFTKLHRDMIEDGMEVMIKSSGTDKIRAQNNAMNLAKLGPPFIDPLSLFKDMEIDDPEGRAEMGMAFANDPATYITKFILGMKDPKALVNGLLGQGAANELMGQPPNEAAPPVMGAPPVPATNPSPENTGNVPIAPPAVPEGSPRIL